VAVPDLMKLRHRLLFEPAERADPAPQARGVRLGLPRTLEFYNSMPFWRTLFESLGFEVVLSKRSDVALFERGLGSVPSDTICFPAKLAHGHIQDLIARGVDRIFMPMMVKIPTENPSTKGVHTCAVVQGYPVIVNEADEPLRRHGVAFDHPIFHWYTLKLRDRQIADYLGATFGIARREVRAAIAQADAAVTRFNRQLPDRGREVLDALEGSDDFAVILAGRPYHSDPLVNHDLSSHFTRLGIPVLTIDALPDVAQVDLSRVRAETVNPFHVRMYGGAIFGARHPNLEVVQIVSFGCGHDAVITEEMNRLVRAISDKQLLVLKLDEGEATGPLNIRIKSFVETVRARRKRDRAEDRASAPRELPRPFEVLFEKKDVKQRVILAPNISRAFCEVVTAVGKGYGYRIEPLPLADARAIELGKKYLHNDICFPAQINVGECLALLEKGIYSSDEVVLGLAKNCDDCRAGQYAGLARKALDDAGYPDIPIMTTGEDTKGMHPGFAMGMKEQVSILWGLAIMDAMDDMLRQTRPYEVTPGFTDQVFERCFRQVLEGLRTGHKAALAAFADAVQVFNSLPIERAVRRPRVGIIGEILLNYHPTSNGNLVRYLEANGMETILPSMVDFFRRDLIRIKEGVKRHHIPNPFLNSLMAGVQDHIYRHVVAKVDAIYRGARTYHRHKDVYELSRNIEDFIDPTYMVGEGWLIPAEIIELWGHGVRAFVIVQPFGCLPNHITGRGLVKAIKRRCPDAQIVSLDYDPDTSFANVENRLQMLIMSAKELERARAAAAPPAPLPEPDSALPA